MTFKNVKSHFIISSVNFHRILTVLNINGCRDLVVIVKCVYYFLFYIKLCFLKYLNGNFASTYEIVLRIDVKGNYLCVIL